MPILSPCRVQTVMNKSSTAHRGSNLRDESDEDLK